MTVEWAWQKAWLLFLGFLAKGVAFGDPLPFVWGVWFKAVCSVVWLAFDGAFMWLLKPPSQYELEFEPLGAGLEGTAVVEVTNRN